MECMSEQERYANGNLGREFLLPLLGNLAIIPLIEEDSPNGEPSL